MARKAAYQRATSRESAQVSWDEGREMGWPFGTDWRPFPPRREVYPSPGNSFSPARCSIRSPSRVSCATRVIAFSPQTLLPANAHRHNSGSNSAHTSETSSGCSSGRNSEVGEHEDDERKESANLHDLSNESIEEEDEAVVTGGEPSPVSQGYVTFQPSPIPSTSARYRPPPQGVPGYTQMRPDGWRPRPASPPSPAALPPGYSRASAAIDDFAGSDGLGVPFPVQSQERG